MLTVGGPIPYAEDPELDEQRQLAECYEPLLLSAAWL